MAWRKEAVWMGAARLSLVLGQFLLLVVVARHLGGESGGRFALAFAITAPVFAVTDLNLRSVYVTYRERLSWPVYLRLRVTTLLLALVVTAVIAHVQGSVAPRTLILMGLAKAFDSLTDLHFGALQRFGRGRLIFRCCLVNAVLTMGLGIAGLWWTSQLDGALGGSVVASSLTTVLAIVLSREARARDFSIESAPGDWRDLIHRGLPLGLAAGFMSVSVFFPQYVLDAFESKTTVLVYAMLGYVMTAAQLVVNAVTQALMASQSMVRHRGGGRIDMKPFLGEWRRLTFAAALAAGAFLLVAPVGLRTGILEQGVPNSLELTPFAIALVGVPALFISMAALNVLNAYRWVMWGNLVGLVVVLCSTPFFVAQWGLVGALSGAALSIIVRAAVMFAGIRIAQRSPG